MRSASQLLEAHLDLMTRDFDRWKALFAPDAIMEFVYGASAHVDSPLVGIEAIARSVKGFLNAITDFQHGPLRILKIEGEQAVLAEFSADARVRKTGRHYHQDYAIYIRAQDGRIAFYREYFDPARIVAAFESLA
jgi:ketosteroid isomerase-like protein